MKQPDTLNDEEVALRAKEGSEIHFNELVDRYTSMVYRIALGITGSSQEAEEIVQETFWKVFENLGEFSVSKGSFKTWLLTIARNQSISHFRHLKRRIVRLFARSYDQDEDIGSQSSWNHAHLPNPESLLLSKERTLWIRSTLEKLPERQRTALVLHAQEGLSQTEIASVMNISISSVESLLYRARKSLMELLKD
jgi:RNA polymerase sigma factor (sigma-70 family)